MGETVSPERVITGEDLLAESKTLFDLSLDIKALEDWLSETTRGIRLSLGRMAAKGKLDFQPRDFSDLEAGQLFMRGLDIDTERTYRRRAKIANQLDLHHALQEQTVLDTNQRLNAFFNPESGKRSAIFAQRIDMDLTDANLNTKVQFNRAVLFEPEDFDPRKHFFRYSENTGWGYFKEIKPEGVIILNDPVPTHPKFTHGGLFLVRPYNLETEEAQVKLKTD